MIVPMKTPPVTARNLKAALVASGSPEKAAPALGVSRRTVYRWMDFYGIRARVSFERAPEDIPAITA